MADTLNQCTNCAGRGQVRAADVPGGWAKCGECSGSGRASAAAVPEGALPPLLDEKQRFNAWFDQAYPMVDCRRPKYQASTVPELMRAAWDAAVANRAQESEPVTWLRVVEPDEIPDWPWPFAFVDSSTNEAILEALGAFPVYRARAAVEADRARQQDMPVRLAGAPAGQHKASTSVMADRAAFQEWFNGTMYSEDAEEAMLIGWQASTVHYAFTRAGAPTEASDVSADRAQQGEPVFFFRGDEKIAFRLDYYADKVPEGATALYRAATKAAAPADAPDDMLEELMHKHALIGVAGDNPNWEAKLIAYANDARRLPADAMREAERLYRSWAHQQSNRCQLAPWYRLDDESKAEWISKVAAPAPDTGIPNAGEVPSIEDADLTWAIAGKLGEFYPQETPRDMEKNHRLARAIQRLPLLRQTVAATVKAELASRCRAQGGMTKDNDNFRAPVSSTPTSGAVEKADAVAWALASPKGGIKKVAITRASVESRMARWLEEWPDNTPRIRPLVYGDADAAPSLPSEAKAGKDA